MRRFVIFTTSILLFANTLYAESMDDQNTIPYANELFKQGKFAEAKAVYAEIVDEESNDYDAVLALGRISLYENAFSEADKWLQKAIELNPDDEKPKALLAEAYYRRDMFGQAAPLFRAVGNAPMADKLQYLSNKIPYHIESDIDITTIEFVQTDPLPIVKMRINGSEEALFIIDTGGWELILESSFADSIGAKKFGGRLATYAGGMQDSTFHGAVDQVQIGDFIIRNVPVHINNSPKGMAAMMEMPIRGVIGTVFLYHFVFTLDYPNDQLILQKKTEDNIRQMKNLAKAKDNIVIPFWMSGDHIIVAWGTVNESAPMLFFVDTGLAGGGFVGTDKTVKQANIKLPEESAEGVGGGGKVSVKRVIVDEVTLGEAREENVVGFFGAVPNLGKRFGYEIGGIVSHGFFRSYKLTFDFTTMNLILKRSAG